MRGRLRGKVSCQQLSKPAGMAGGSVLQNFAGFGVSLAGGTVVGGRL